MSFVVTFILLFSVVVGNRKVRPVIAGFHLPSRRGNVSTALFTIFVSACYCFVTDRTQVFEKRQRLFSKADFGAKLGVVALVCLLNIRGVPLSQYPRPRVALTTFLPQAQTDECKGWLQVFLLVYRYTDGQRTLELYQLHRIAIAFYLFLFGYGHAMYFL